MNAIDHGRRLVASMKVHYKTKLRQGRVRTSAAIVTNKWITQPTFFPPGIFGLFASSRLGLLPVKAHHQPQTDTNTRTTASAHIATSSSKPPNTRTPRVGVTSINDTCGMTTPSLKYCRTSSLSPLVCCPEPLGTPGALAGDARPARQR